MNFYDTYLMSSALMRNALHVAFVGDVSRLEPIKLARGELTPTKALVFKYKAGASGGTPCDLVSTDIAVIKLVSSRVTTLFEQFTGWSTFEVLVYGKDGRCLPGYRGLAITGRCGAIDNLRSTAIQKPPLAPRGRPYEAWVGLYFDESSWDGSHCFMPADKNYIFVTGDVKRSIEDAGASNFRFERLAEFERGVVEMSM